MAHEEEDLIRNNSCVKLGKRWLSTPVSLVAGMAAVWMASTSARMATGAFVITAIPCLIFMLSGTACGRSLMAATSDSSVQEVLRGMEREESHRAQRGAMRQQGWQGGRGGGQRPSEGLGSHRPAGSIGVRPTSGASFGEETEVYILPLLEEEDEVERVQYEGDHEEGNEEEEEEQEQEQEEQEEQEEEEVMYIEEGESDEDEEYVSSEGENEVDSDGEEGRVYVTKGGVAIVIR